MIILQLSLSKEQNGSLSHDTLECANLLVRFLEKDLARLEQEAVTRAELAPHMQALHSRLGEPSELRVLPINVGNDL